MQDNPDRKLAQQRGSATSLPSSLETSLPPRRSVSRSTERISDRENRLLRSLLQSIDFPMYVVDANTREIVLANAAVCRNGPPWGVTCYALTHHRATPCDGTNGPCPLEIVRRTKRPVTVEHRHYGTGGSVRYFEIHAVPILDGLGRVTEMIEYNIDVTERRRVLDAVRAHEHALELLIRQLELSNEELAGFASIIAHDMRSPLQSISSSAATLDLAFGEQSDATTRRALEILVGGVERLKDMITSLYRCCQVSRGVLHVVDVDLTRLVHELCSFQLVEDIAESGGQIVIEEPLREVRGDEMQILELLQNLISNALKFRRENDAPRIQVRTVDLADGRVRIEVEDNGVGIASTEEEKIFEMFTRLDDRHAGLGIGLAFCKRVALRHGGRIGVNSRHGFGSTFWVELPSAGCERNVGSLR